MKKGTAITFAVGVLAGITLRGPAAQAATTVLTATLSTQPIYVNGQRAPMTAYAIGGNNYVRLRDVGEAVNFGVTYDAATNSVYIDPGAHYQKEVKPSEQAPSSPAAALTEENVRAAIRALRDIYPSGALYPAPYRSASNGPYGTAPRNCAGWATLCSDAAFGDLPWRKIDRPAWDQIRAGDLVEYTSSSAHHVVVVLKRTNEYISVTESGANSKAQWGGQYFKWWLEEQPSYILYTRYPS